MPHVRSLFWRRPQPHEMSVESVDAVLMARARPRKVLVEESYTVRQEISRNPDVTLDDGAAGVIRVEMPYDGDRYVTRTTLDDVKHWAARNPRPSGPGRHPETAAGRIGHLIVSRHQDTDLAEITGQSDRTIALPLIAPFGSPGMDDERALLSDRLEFRHEMSYALRGGRPKVIPVQLDVEVVDPGSVTVQEIQPDDAVAQSEQYMTFSTYLELRIVVQVDMHNRKNWTPPNPVVRRIRLSLPSGLTLALSSVEVSSVAVMGDDVIDDERSTPLLVQQNLEEGCLECFDIPLQLTGPPKEDGRRYRSPLIRVRINQPGELFRESDLVVGADVETDGVLLSGADARLFDACGSRMQGRGNPLTVRSKVTAEATVVLDHAFAKRIVRPQLKFHFDEVIPVRARVDDVVAALVDLRFDVKRRGDFGRKIGKAPTGVGALIATRGDSEDAIRLIVYITGRQHRTERQSQHPGGRRFTSKLDTGDMTVVIYGAAPRDSRQLIHDVNALQSALRDRFRRMQAQR